MVSMPPPPPGSGNDSNSMIYGQPTTTGQSNIGDTSIDNTDKSIQSTDIEDSSAAAAPQSPPRVLQPPPPSALMSEPMSTSSQATSSSASASLDTESPPTNTISYHPDFMFCGECTACHEADSAAGGIESTTTNQQGKHDHHHHHDLDNDWDDNNDTDDDDDMISSCTQTAFQLTRRNKINASQRLVIQSILRPISGVKNVKITSTSAANDRKEEQHKREMPTIIVDHDASVSAESLLHSIQSVGHSAFVQSSHNHMNRSQSTLNNNEDGNSHYDIVTATSDTHSWVRSQFYVRGICCASEIPAVRKIVKPLKGVSKLNINLTTKVVHVQHDISQIQAQDIAQALTSQGFPSQIQKDGAHMAKAKQVVLNSNPRNGRTTLHVQGILHERDITTIRSTLSQLKGIAKIGVNISEAVIYIDHNIDQVSSQQCADQITNSLTQFPCSVAIPGERAAGDVAAAALDQIGRSRYVESTLCLEGLQPYHVSQVEKAISQNFIHAQVRAIYPSISSETIKVEHDPKLVSIENICDIFQNYYNDGKLPFATVFVDGAHANLYLPLEEDYPENQVSHRDEPSLFKIHANVWLSGIFWILSMISYVDGKEWFKYFGLASVLFGLPPIAIKAWRTIRRFQFDANCMMVTAAVGALALGEYDEAASVAFLFAVSEFLEARATLKARKALEEICALRPDHANVIHPITKEIVVVPADRVPLGSLISVRTGDKIAADGVVVEGSSSIDESSLTGESQPVHKTVSDAVSGGTINIGLTQLVVKTTTTVEDSAVSRLIRLVEEAQSNRSPTEKMIDTFARSYTPTVMVMALLMCTIPWAFGTEIGRHWTLNGLIIIVIACPCALTISTPVTYAAGLAAAAQRGIIIKGGSKLEAMGSVDLIVFDKTGTLTKGSFSVTHLEVTSAAKSRQEMLELLTLMQQRSSHPLSSSLVQAAKDEGINVPRHMTVADHQILKGEGITAKVNGTSQLYIGNQRLFNRLGLIQSLPSKYMQYIKAWSDTGGTLGFIGSQEDGIIGMFCVKDSVREEARGVIQELKTAGIKALICTGDSDAAAQAVAKEIGIPSSCVQSQLLPEDKLHFVGSLKRPHNKRCGICRKHKYVLFCGDGVNDAPALAVADIGVSMGEGAAMALEMSDITLMDSKLTKLCYAIQMGRRVLRTVKENITISLFAKLTVVALTFLGKMTLLYAIASDVGIMLLVTLNGMKLLPGKTLMELTSLKMKKRHASKHHFELIGTNVANHAVPESEVVSTAEIV